VGPEVTRTKRDISNSAIVKFGVFGTVFTQFQMRKTNSTLKFFSQTCLAQLHRESEKKVEQTMPVVFIHCPYLNPHPTQMGKVWVENNYPLKKWGG
jgi:hypothetical protein